VTEDGEHLSILINASLLIEVPHLESTGAEGIGLYRTEIPFMVRAEYPDVLQQTEFYRSILEQADGTPGHVPHAGRRRRQDPALFPGI
jgi:phosphotransferase system enzyme I (PtsP)